MFTAIEIKCIEQTLKRTVWSWSLHFFPNNIASFEYALIVKSVWDKPLLAVYIPLHNQTQPNQLHSNC